MKHPMQKTYIDESDRLRFVENKIINHLVTHCMDLNTICQGVLDGQFPREDYEQLMGLVGYSLDGYQEISMVSDEAKDLAYEMQVELQENSHS